MYLLEVKRGAYTRISVEVMETNQHICERF